MENLGQDGSWDKKPLIVKASNIPFIRNKRNTILNIPLQNKRNTWLKRTRSLTQFKACRKSFAHSFHIMKTITIVDVKVKGQNQIHNDKNYCTSWILATKIYIEFHALNHDKHWDTYFEKMTIDKWKMTINNSINS